MENDNNLVQVTANDGTVLNMLILNEFEYKEKKYAVLMEMDKACSCEECECDDCDCEEESRCDDSCKCHSNDECSCDEPIMTILEITKEDGSEVFKSVDDEKLFEEICNEADKLLSE